MNVRFFTEDGKVGNDGKRIEFVSISGDFMGKDEVVREATDDDRHRFNSAYDAFKNPPAEPEPAAAPPAPAVPAAPTAPALAPIDPAGKVS